jgi:hypothetical protein
MPKVLPGAIPSRFQQEINSDVLNSPFYQPVSQIDKLRSCDAFAFNLWLIEADLIQ